jgi:hypothetical protein
MQFGDTTAKQETLPSVKYTPSLHTTDDDFYC